MRPAIRVEKVSKLYRTGSTGSYQTLRESLMDAAAGSVRAARRLVARQPAGTGGDRLAPDSFWALKDVCFDVTPGDVVGVVGRNGAGKSTLLKVLSRVTEPTAGRVEVRGRIGSLLEVGTGFHPELTGRENIYLNGSILGMSRREIERKFDEIVNFAGVEQFLDMPVKRYSSGMYVRLAFAVAAHLEPETLVIDEVLAVGDIDFQNKCMGKMQSVAKGGRTILFVSHNMGVLKTICSKGILLAGGRLVAQGPINDVVEAYLRTLERKSTDDLAERTDRRGRGAIRLLRVDISMGPGFPPNALVMGQPAELAFELSDVRKDFDLSFTIYDHRGTAVSNLDTWRRAPCDSHSGAMGNRVICRIGELPLRSGRYFLSTRIMHNRELQDLVEGAAFFDVENAEFRGRSFPYTSTPGVVCIDHSWVLPR
jgi:lipopolysaccharide transport system ATP-binding protein